MIIKLLVSTSKIAVILFVVIILLWLILARPSFHTNKTLKKSINEINPDVLKKHVVMLSENFSPRSYKHPENLNKVADYIANSFKTSGAKLSEQLFEVYGTHYRNIIAEYGPESREIIIVGAHYDTNGEQPGADDNASGVAGLLELGQLLAHKELQSRIVLVAFTLEEPPFFRTDKMGSAFFAKSLSDSNTKVKLMIALEMIGYFSEDKGSQNYPAPLLRLYYPSTGNFIAVVDQLLSSAAQRIKQSMTQSIEIPVYSINAPSFIPGVDFSDHMNFWQQGYPAIMVTDTAFYRNDAYHTKEDTAERLNYEKMVQVIYGVFNYVSQLDSET